MNIVETVNKVVRPLKQRIQSMVARGILDLVNDSKGIQTVQVSLLADETSNNLERFQEYGFTSKPRTGAEAAVLFLGGCRDHGIVIATEDRRYRLKGLQDGEVALYTDEGDSIELRRGKIVVNSQNVELGKGTLEKVLNGEKFQTRFNNHTHTGNLGALTTTPTEPSDASDLSSVVKASTGAE